jgi:hypothetical protein
MVAASVRELLGWPMRSALCLVFFACLCFTPSSASAQGLVVLKPESAATESIRVVRPGENARSLEPEKKDTRTKMRNDPGAIRAEDVNRLARSEGRVIRMRGRTLDASSW